MLSNKIKKMFPGIESALDSPKVRRFVEIAEKYLAVQKELEQALLSCQNDGFFPGPVDSPRFRLPTTRKGTTTEAVFSCEDEQITLFIRPGTFDDGRLGEVFINADRQGSFTSGMIDAFSIVLSLALQHGVPLRRILDKLENTRFGKIGVIGESRVRRPTSVIDFVAKTLKVLYLPKEPDEPHPV